MAGPITRKLQEEFFAITSGNKTRPPQLADASKRASRRRRPASPQALATAEPRLTDVIARETFLMLASTSHLPNFKLQSPAYSHHSASFASGGTLHVQQHAKARRRISGYLRAGFLRRRRICADQFLRTAPPISACIGIALAHGLAIAIMISALGHISGGHFNPAVTIGFWVTKRLNTIDVDSATGSRNSPEPSPRHSF